MSSTYYEDKVDNAYDIGLNEFPLYFDVADEDEGQTYIVAGIDEGSCSYKEGQFLPRGGVWASGGGTITAPSFINIGNTSYTCKGHRIDRMVDGVWVWGTPVLDGATTVDYTPANETDKFRFVWLWEDMNYFVEKKTTTWKAGPKGSVPTRPTPWVRGRRGLSPPVPHRQRGRMSKRCQEIAERY